MHQKALGTRLSDVNIARDRIGTHEFIVDKHVEFIQAYHRVVVENLFDVELETADCLAEREYVV